MHARIDERKLNSELKQFESAMKQLEQLVSEDAGKLLWKYSSQFVAQLVAKTQPRGAHAKALQTGQAAVARDIDKVYAKPGRIYARIKEQSEDLADYFYAAWSNNDTNRTIEAMRQADARISKIPVIRFDGGLAHRNARTSKGRVRSNFSNSVLVEKSSAGDVKLYVRHKQKLVGSTKAGWVKGFNPPSGVKGVPSWVLNNEGGKGKVVDMTKVSGPKRIIFENHMEWISSNFNANAAIQAMTWVRKRIEKDIEKSVIENSKKV